MVLAIHAKSLYLTRQTEIGVKHIAKCFEKSGSLAEGRGTLFKLSLERMRPMAGESSREVAEYRRLAVRALCPGGGLNTLRAAMLLTLPNGEWRNHREVVVYVGDGRFHWAGGEEQCCSVPILEVCCGLLGPLFRMLCALQRRKTAKRPQGRRQQPTPLPTIPRPARGERQMPQVVADGDAVGAEAVDYAKELSWHQRLGLKWLDSGEPEPLSQLIVYRNCLAPLQQVLSHKLHISSERWGIRQQAQAINKDAVSPDGLNRDFRILVAARSTAEEPSLQRSIFLMKSESQCMLLTNSNLAVNRRTPALIMISRALAMIERSLSLTHRQVKCMLLLLLEGTQDTDRVLHVRPHRPWIGASTF